MEMCMIFQLIKILLINLTYLQVFKYKEQYKIMFSQFIVVLNFRKSLARDRTKCLFLNNEPLMVRPTLN